MPKPTVPEHLRHYVMDYNATSYGTWQIKQGHADVCKIVGHATNTENGVLQPYCPRCGDPR